MHLLYPPPRRRGALSNTAIHPSVCPSPRRAAALGYRHADCLQLSHVRTADLFADGHRSAASRTAIGGGHIVSGDIIISGDNLFVCVFKYRTFYCYVFCELHFCIIKITIVAQEIERSESRSIETFYRLLYSKLRAYCVRQKN